MLCIQACPVDAIVGAVRLMHTVIPQWCNGCDLCVAPCPMDCIEMVPVQPPRRWTDDDAHESRRRHEARRARLVLEAAERAQARVTRAHARLDAIAGRDDGTADEAARRHSLVQAAIERARARRQEAAKP